MQGALPVRGLASHGVPSVSLGSEGVQLSSERAVGHQVLVPGWKQVTLRPLVMTSAVTSLSVTSLQGLAAAAVAAAVAVAARGGPQ